MIFKQVKILHDLLREQEVSSGQILSAIGLTMVLAALESAGLGMLLPILTFVEKGASTFTAASGPTKMVVDLMAWLDLPMTFATLTTLCVIPLILRQLVMYARFILIARLTHEGTRILRRQAIAVALNADLPFFIERKHGDFPNSLLMEPQNAGSISYVGIGIVLNVLVCIAYFAMMFYVSWPLTVLTIPLVLVVGVIVRRCSRRAREWSLRIKDDQELLFQDVSETVRGIRLVKSRAYENETVDRLDKISMRIVEDRMGFDYAKSFLDSYAPLVLSLGVFALLYIAVDQMKMTLADLGFFMFVVMRLQQVVTQLNQDRLSFIRQMVSVEYVREFAAAASARHLVVGGTKPFTLKRELKFQDVGFQYDGARGATKVLDGLSFSLKVGETVAIVGRSGVGKTTVIDLILRHFQAKQGMITVDGVPLDSIAIESLRRNIGVVTQDTFLFHETVRHNLCFGLKEPQIDEAMWKVLAQAHADGFVRQLPKGLDTLLGEGGADLSGGQRQRLSLARALAQAPQLLVLDEPTSALDSESEAAIQDTLRLLHGNVTILVIAHRLATISSADRILVMESGKIVAEGDHGTLIERNPTYRSLFKGQAA